MSGLSHKSWQQYPVGVVQSIEGAEGSPVSGTEEQSGRAGAIMSDDCPITQFLTIIPEKHDTAR